MRFKALFARKWVLAILIALVFACGGSIAFAQPRQSAHAAADTFTHGASHSGTNLNGAAATATKTLNAGAYYLSADLNCNITIAVNVIVDLCLNGHILTGNGGSVITVNAGAKLNLYDCGNGRITGGNGDHSGSTSYGAGVQLEGGAEFNMYGGAITGNIMAANANEYGGGVNVSYGAKFNMYGGTISGNSAKNGAAVSVTEKNGGISQTPSTFNMYGGAITGNTSALGAVHVASDGEFNLYAESQVTITGNTGGNVYIDGPTAVKGPGVFNVKGEIAANSQIGVTLASAVTAFGSGYATNNPGVDPKHYFVSDDQTTPYCGLNDVGLLVFTPPHEVNLVEFANTRAWISKQRSLASGPVYKYISDEDGGELYSTDSVIPEGYTDGGELPAINSVAAYTGREITVALSGGTSEYYEIEYQTGTDKGTGIGRYETVVTLTITDPSSEFVVKGAATADNPDRGITIEISSDKKTAAVTKTWYIVQNVVENANMLLDATESAGGNTVEYAVAEYTFGENCAITMPRLKYGDDGENWASNGNITFVLTLLKADGTEDVTTDGFTRAQFANYINRSMPAGEYRLEINVADVDTTEGTTWWGEPTVDGIHYGSISETYNFTVSPATIGFDLEKDEQTGYADYEWEYRDNVDKRTFFDAFKSELTAHAPTFKTIVGEGYWARYNSGDDVRYFAGSFDANSVKYNLARLYNNAYLTLAELQNSIEGGANGTYKVFFQISAPNHVDLAVGADRYNYFFTVNVYRKVALPTVPNVDYTGSKILPNIASDTRYTVEWDENDEYVSGGQHYVTFTLTDYAHYRWNSTSTSGDHNESVRVGFTVNKANNSWLKSPSVIGWEYGGYDAQNNALSAVARYLDDGQSVHFTVTTDSAGTNPVAGLESFVATDVSAQATLAALSCNTYYIKATVAATDNYNALESTAAPFRVTKLSNRWVESPTIMRWSEGAYDPEKNIIVAVPMRGEDVMTAIIRDENGTEYYNSATGLNNLKDAPAGQYSLYVSIEETANYSGLEKEMLFRVFDAEGFPWWVVLIIVLAVALIALIILIVLYKKDVLQIISEKMIIAIRTRADADATIAAIKAGKVSAEAERLRLEREAALAAEDAASDAEEALPEVEDEPEEAVYEPEDGDVEVPSSGGFKKIFEESSSERYTYGKTVLSKLINAPDVVKARYSEIKNALLGFKKARASMSRARESYYIGRNCYARISMRGKTLCLYIAQDPETYKDTKYNVESVLGVKSYADTPSLIRLRSDRAVRYAKELIEELAERIGAVKIERKPENYAELFKTIAQFEKKRLLSYDGRKQKVEQPKAPNKGDE